MRDDGESEHSAKRFKSRELAGRAAWNWKNGRTGAIAEPIGEEQQSASAADRERKEQSGEERVEDQSLQRLMHGAACLSLSTDA